MRHAATLAGQVGASVELLHAIEEFSYSYGVSSEVYVPNIPDMMQLMINNASERLAAIKAGNFPHGSDVQTSVFVGRPAHTIVERARAGGFDLIVMGTHGRAGLTHMLMGSVAERVVRSAPCAVLTVRENGAAETARPPAHVEAA